MNRKKTLSILPGVISLLLATAPVIPFFTHAALADPVRNREDQLRKEYLRQQINEREKQNQNLKAQQRAKLQTIHNSDRQIQLTAEQKRRLQQIRERQAHQQEHSR